MISTQDELRELQSELADGEWVGVDTEADSLHAYPEKLCLIQLSVGKTEALVDPLAGLDLEPLLARLRRQVLIFHGADYDLRLLYRSFGFVPDHIFDTMWAARLIGAKEFGLSSLVQQRLGVALEKGPQKMNWAVRPLTGRMTAYAVNDIRYLRALAQLLRTELERAGRLEWHRQVCAKVVREACTLPAQDGEEPWRIKGSDRLDRRALAVLRELWHWREEEALAANKPPYFVLSHERLVQLSCAVAHGKSARPCLPQHFRGQRAGRLSKAIGRALQLPPATYPLPRRSTGKRLSKEQQAEFERFKQVRDERARELGIDPTLLANKGDLVLLARDCATYQHELMPWQRGLLVPA